MNERTQATARVTVTLEIEANGAWGPACTVEQVEKQARDSALGYLRNTLDLARVRVVGPALVSMIVVAPPGGADESR